MKIIITKQDLARLAKDDPESIRIESRLNDQGKKVWEIWSGSSVFQDDNGNQLFVDLALLHALLSECGFTRFEQDGVQKLFFEDPDFLKS